jgi:hypothetical protein
VIRVAGVEDPSVWLTRLFIFVGGFLGEPGEHPWRFRLVALLTIGTGVTLLDHFAGFARYNTPAEAWGRAIMLGVILGVICTAICEWVVRRHPTD